MQIDKTSISEINSSFPVESQLSIGSRANHTLLKSDIECQVKKNLLPEETIVQTSNQGIYTPSPASTQISSTQSSLSHNEINSKNSQYILNGLKKR